MFFNYATNYFYENKTIVEPSKFSLNDADYKSFKEYASKHQADFETSTEAEFLKASKKAEEENLDGGLTSSYSNLLKNIQSEKLKELDKNKDEILSKLTEEIVKRYYYEEGVYQQKAVFDATILEAVSLLNNTSEYNKILKN